MPSRQSKPAASTPLDLVDELDAAKKSLSPVRTAIADNTDHTAQGGDNKDLHGNGDDNDDDDNDGNESGGIVTTGSTTRTSQLAAYMTKSIGRTHNSFFSGYKDEYDSHYNHGDITELRNLKRFVATRLASIRPALAILTGTVTRDDIAKYGVDDDTFCTFQSYAFSDLMGIFSKPLRAKIYALCADIETDECAGSTLWAYLMRKEDTAVAATKQHYLDEFYNFKWNTNFDVETNFSKFSELYLDMHTADPEQKVKDSVLRKRLFALLPKTGKWELVTELIKDKIESDEIVTTNDLYEHLLKKDPDAKAKSTNGRPRDRANGADDGDGAPMTRKSLQQLLKSAKVPRGKVNAAIDSILDTKTKANHERRAERAKGKPGYLDDNGKHVLAQTVGDKNKSPGINPICAAKPEAWRKNHKYVDCQQIDLSC